MVNPAVERQTKHIDIQHHYIREQYENKVIEPFHVTSIDNPLVHKVFTSRQSGTIQVKNQTIIVWFSGSVETE